MDRLKDIANKIQEMIPVTTDPGLLYGKMGMVIFFFHYARFSGQEEYEDIGMKLIESIFENIDRTTPANYASGLAGIGVGIEYLIQNKFIEGDGNEILEEVDGQIFNELIYREKIDCSLKDGLCGLGKYYWYRVNTRKSWKEEIITLRNRQNIIYLLDRLDLQKEYSAGNRLQILYLLTQLYALDIFNVKLEKLIRFYDPDYDGDIIVLRKKIIFETDKDNNNSFSASTRDLGFPNGLVKTGLSLM